MPQAHRTRMLLVVALDQTLGHVAAEAVDALVHPERDDVLQFVAYGRGARIVVPLLPGLSGVGMQVAVVERGLDVEEVLHVVAVARGVAANEFLGRERILRIAPDIVVAVLQFRIGFGRLTEPRMFVRRVARHEIQTDADAQVVGLADELHQLGIGAETRVDPVEIGDVVTAVLEFAPEDGAEPNGVRAQAFDVGQFGADAFQITDAVAVAVFEGGGVDVVENPLFEPFGDLLCGCGQQEKRGCQCEKSAFHRRCVWGSCPAGIDADGAEANPSVGPFGSSGPEFITGKDRFYRVDLQTAECLFPFFFVRKRKRFGNNSYLYRVKRNIFVSECRNCPQVMPEAETVVGNLFDKPSAEPTAVRTMPKRENEE